MIKKTIGLSLLLVTIIAVTSCKNTEKKEAKPSEKSYLVDSKSTVINWTAFKTTAKLPVKGQFTDVSFENAKNASTAMEALNGLKFSIPVSSLFTKDTIRDRKLKTIFFGALKNTELISGTISMNTKNSGSVDLIMNGMSQVLPITYTIVDQTVTIEALMNLDNWQAQTALEALDVACKALHSGPDGISKTWNEVKIAVVTNLKVE